MNVCHGVNLLGELVLGSSESVKVGADLAIRYMSRSYLFYFIGPPY